MSRFNVIHWNGQMLVYEGAKDAWTAHYLGDIRPVNISAPLLAAIEADVLHQHGKKTGFDDEAVVEPGGFEPQSRR